MEYTPRAIRPDDLEVIAQIPGIVAVARDEEMRLFWHSPSCKWMPGKSGVVVNLMGTVLEDVISVACAHERNIVHRRVMESGQSESHYRVSLGARMLCTVYPLDEEAFGHRGVFAVSVDAPISSRLIEDGEIPVLYTPNLFELNELSSRELEVLHYVARGLSTQEIAGRLCRATKTVEHHVNSIHGKIGTHSRAQLVRFASERGIQSFSDEEWASIVEGARVVRKEGSQTRSTAEIKPRGNTGVESV